MADHHTEWPPPSPAVDSARNGDRGVLATILQNANPRLIGFYRGSGLNPSDAADLAADTLEAMVVGLGKLRSSKAFEGWMWAIARTRLKMWLRRERRPVRNQPPSPPGATPEEAVEVAEEHVLIRDALDLLSTRDRQLLWLREVEGLDYTAIGRRLGSAAGATRVACHRARRRLEAAFAHVESEQR